MPELEDAMAEMNEQYGLRTIVPGNELIQDPPRLPFGVFPVDFATGGGCPIWGTTCLWGPEAGGKTSLAINAMAMVPRLCWRCFRLKKQCICSKPSLAMRSIWADVEGTFDRSWAVAIGTDPNDYHYALGDYGEMYIDIVERALRSDNCALAVVDSLAALMPVREFEAASEAQFMGNQARMIGSAIRKLKQRLILERKREHPCAIIFINQMRQKIGEMFGNPETMPGGHAMLHELSLVLRVVQKALTEADKGKFSGAGRKKDAATRHAFLIRKAKVPTMAKSGEFVRLVEWVNELKGGKGLIDDYQTTLSYAKQYGVLEKKGAHWKVGSFKAKRQSDMVRFWRTNLEVYHMVQAETILAAKGELEKAAHA